MSRFIKSRSIEDHPQQPYLSQLSSILSEPIHEPIHQEPIHREPIARRSSRSKGMAEDRTAAGPSLEKQGRG